MQCPVKPWSMRNAFQRARTRCKCCDAARPVCRAAVVAALNLREAAFGATQLASYSELHGRWEEQVQSAHHTPHSNYPPRLHYRHEPPARLSPFFAADSGRQGVSPRFFA
jgi:ribosomal protein S14